METVASFVPPYRIMLVDDHQLVLDGVESLLTHHFKVTIVDRVNNGLEVYSACQRSKPDIVLIDLGLPGMNGIDVIYRLKRHWPNLSILVLTASRMVCKAREAMAAGAQAYVLKHSNQEIFFSAFKAIMAGKRFIDPNLNLLINENILALNKIVHTKKLTKREIQILKLVAEGYKNRDMAEKLSISIKTVETHRLNLMKKLDVHNVAGMITWSARLGLIEEAI